MSSSSDRPDSGAQSGRPEPAQHLAPIRTEDDLLSCLKQGPVRGRRIEASSLAQVSFENAVFEDCTFVSQLQSCDLPAATFTGCTFSRVRFASCALEESVFRSCHFFDLETRSGCVFAFCNLEKAEFVSCNLSSSKFDGCDLFLAQYNQCNLRGLDMIRVRFWKSYSKKHIVNKVSFTLCNLSHASLEELDLSECVISDCQCIETSFQRSNLTGSELVGTVLRNCHLHRTNLTNANLRNAELEGVLLGDLAGYSGMVISEGQQNVLLGGLGIRVAPV